MNRKEVLDKIEYLRTLKDDWDGYETPGPNSVAAENAIGWVDYLLETGIGISWVGPCGDDRGGVGIEIADQQNLYADICFFNNGVIEWNFMVNGDWTIIELRDGIWVDLSNEEY